MKHLDPKIRDLEQLNTLVWIFLYLIAACLGSTMLCLGLQNIGVSVSTISYYLMAIFGGLLSFICVVAFSIVFLGWAFAILRRSGELNQDGTEKTNSY